VEPSGEAADEDVVHAVAIERAQERFDVERHWLRDTGRAGEARGLLNRAKSFLRTHR
jgi:hypothetical protein